MRSRSLLRVAHDVEAGHARRPTVGEQQRRQDPHGGRLAGAVRAEQAEHAAGLDPQVDALQRLGVPVALGELRSLDGGVARHDPHRSEPSGSGGRTISLRLAVDREAGLEVEEVQLPSSIATLEAVVRMRARLGLEPRDQHGPLLSRLRLELLERRRVDVAGDLADLLGEDRRRPCTSRWTQQLRAEGLRGADEPRERRVLDAFADARSCRAGARGGYRDRSSGRSTRASAGRSGEEPGGNRHLLLTDVARRGAPSRASIRAWTRFIGGLPMKLATNRFAGRSKT